MLFLGNDPLGLKDMDRRLKRIKKRLETAEFVPWINKIKWAPELNIRASTYNPFQLFRVVPKVGRPDPNLAEPEQCCDSADGTWRYVINELPAGELLHTWSGNRIGTVMFDGPVLLPVISRRLVSTADDGTVLYAKDPWMSLTPAELLSMRTGVRLARGHTVVVGLGMGHQLIETCKKRTVTKVTLVEVDQELVGWVMPVLRRFFPKVLEKTTVIVGDAYKVLPKLDADVALVDIFKSYGNNELYRSKLSGPLRMDRVWVWGASPVAGDYR
jgi:hypothetical protein